MEAILACHPARSTEWLDRGWQNRVNYDIFAQAPFTSWTACNVGAQRISIIVYTCIELLVHAVKDPIGYPALQACRKHESVLSSPHHEAQARPIKTQPRIQWARAQEKEWRRTCGLRVRQSWPQTRATSSHSPIFPLAACSAPATSG